MKVTFLGTAAAEGIPSPWCECELCRRVMKQGGPDLRRRSSFLVDDDTLVDLGPDFAWQTHAFGIDHLKLERLLVTHTHGDHLQPLELLFRKTPLFSQVGRTLTVIGSRRVFASILAFAADDCGVYRLEDLSLRALEVSAGDHIDDRGLSVDVFEAEHAPGKEAQFFGLERGGRRILIACDTGFPSEETWSALRRFHFDAVIIDSTLGLAHRTVRRGHMGADVAVEFRDRLRKEGCLGAATSIYATHFSHNGGADHAALEAYFNSHGILVAHDGLTMDI